MNTQPRADQMGVIGCDVCGLVLAFPSDQHDAACPRCGTCLHRRRRHSLGRAWLLLAAAALLYVPANLLPVMKIHFLGQVGQPLTIIGGVLDLWRDGAYDVAFVVFVASVALPCAKFIALAGLLLSVQWRIGFARPERARLHRFLEIIGYWSMLDVLVVGILGSLVQFQALGEIEPGAGIFLFGASVILAMFAAHSFDSRLIWDAAEASSNPP